MNQYGAFDLLQCLYDNCDKFKGHIHPQQHWFFGESYNKKNKPKQSWQCYLSANVVRSIIRHNSFRVQMIALYPQINWGAHKDILCTEGIKTLSDIRFVEKIDRKLLVFGRCGLSSNRRAKIEWIEAYPSNKNWVFGGFDGLSSAQGFTLEWVQRASVVCGQVVNKWNFMNFGVSYFSKWICTPSNTRAFLRKRKLSWGQNGMSGNIHLNKNMIQSFPNKPWCWQTVQRREQFDLEWIQYVPKYHRTIPHQICCVCQGFRHFSDPVSLSVTWSALNRTFADLDGGWSIGTRTIIALISAYCCDRVNTLIRPGVQRIWSLYLLRQIKIQMQKKWGSMGWWWFVNKNIYKRLTRSVPWHDPLVVKFFNKELPIHSTLLFQQLDMKIIKLYTRTNWNNPNFSFHPNLTIEWVAKIPKYIWYFGAYGLSYAPRLDIEWLRRFPNKEWSCREILSHKNMQSSWIPIIKSRYHNGLWKKLSYSFMFHPQSFSEDHKQHKKRMVVFMMIWTRIMDKLKIDIFNRQYFLEYLFMLPSRRQ